jgi:hypothetical protein
MSDARLFNMRPVPIEVQGADGRWHSGFLLLSFNADGTVTVRSRRTGAVRQLPMGQWRDPVEIEILGRLATVPVPTSTTPTLSPAAPTP